MCKRRGEKVCKEKSSRREVGSCPPSSGEHKSGLYLYQREDIETLSGGREDLLGRKASAARGTDTPPCQNLEAK